MLKKILSPSSCAQCRVCCVFDREDVWEIPTVSDELKEYILNNIDSAAVFDEKDGKRTFHMTFTDGEELSNCPMLTERGCMLGDNKPFDCRVWPFRIMRLDDKLLGITVSPVCETVSAMPLARLSEFLLGDGLADKMFAYAKENPYIIKPYIENYPVLSIKEG
ncbi:MAG: hypothetical protein J1E39_07650 [Eubacterium sp.]|nr:hypothetical protein [Eubacterium sp.]